MSHEDEKKYKFDRAIMRHMKDNMSDAKAGELVRIFQVIHLGHKNGYEPGGTKYNAKLYKKYFILEKMPGSGGTRKNRLKTRQAQNRKRLKEFSRLRRLTENKAKLR